MTSPTLSVICTILTLSSNGQQPADKIDDMAKFDRYERLRRIISKSVDRNDFPKFKWSEGGNSFTYEIEKKRYSYDLEANASTKLEGKEEETKPFRRPPDRGRQFAVVYNSDKTLKAYTEDRNVYISKLNGTGLVPVTKDGNEKDRIKFGIASWVYGEELGVREAMWFSPDGKKLAFYGFNEKDVIDFYLTIDETKVQNKLDVEPYPKAGAPNPIVDLYIYDLESKQTTKVDAHWDTGVDPDLGHYLYNVRWSPDGKELLFNRTNRRQCIMEFAAANPETGKCRVVIRESHTQSWTEPSPEMQWVEDEKGEKTKFLWLNYRNGYKNLSLVNFDGSGEKPITKHNFDVAGIARFNNKKKVIYYTARDGENPYRLQLHKVNLDGTAEKRLTNPKFSHSVQVNEDCSRIVDTYETVDIPPATDELDGDGKLVKNISKADASRFEKQGLKSVEMFSYTAADGKSTCYGYLMKPPSFDPKRKYPMIVTTYSGPESGTYSERFQVPNPACELGFLVASFDGRGTIARGQAFLDEIYGKLGVVEIDDQAAGVKFLAQRPYVDGKNVGIFGTSYGGYATIMCVLRHPEAFKAGVACSSVTAWENYDSIYTERYMNTPQLNPQGYLAGSAMTYAKDLQGHLLLFYGTLDNNVHPTNTHQLAAALNKAGKNYDMMVGPDMGHAQMNMNKIWSFFCEHLMGLRSEDALKKVFNRRANERRRFMKSQNVE